MSSKSNRSNRLQWFRPRRKRWALLHANGPGLHTSRRSNGQRRERFRSLIRMKTYFDRYASGYPHMSTVERSMEINAIVNALLEKHYELQQVPSKTLERIIEKLYSNHMQNNGTIIGTSAGEEDRDEKSTFPPDYSDATRDDTLDHMLDDTRDRTSDRAFGSTRDGTFDDTQVRAFDV